MAWVWERQYLVKVNRRWNRCHFVDAFFYNFDSWFGRRGRRVTTQEIFNFVIIVTLVNVEIFFRRG